MRGIRPPVSREISPGSWLTICGFATTAAINDSGNRKSVCTETLICESMYWADIIHALRLNISLGHQGVAEPAVFYLLQGMFQNGFKTWQSDHIFRSCTSCTASWHSWHMWSKVPVQEEEDSQNGTRAGNKSEVKVIVWLLFYWILHVCAASCSLRRPDLWPIPITSKISLKMFEAHGRPINVIVCACKDRPTELFSCSQKGFEGFIMRRCRLKIGGRHF